MQDRLKAILEKIKAFWLKFNIKQRVIFIVAFVAIVVAIIVVSKVANKEKMVTLRACTSAEEAVEVRNYLSESGINCKVDDNYVVTVGEKDYVEAKLVIGSNHLSSDGYSLDDALSGSFNVTADDKKKKYTRYLESKFENDLEKIKGIKSASITIHFEDNGTTIFSENSDASITATLKLSKPLDEGQAEAIGRMLAANVGSDNTNNVVILDDEANMLYYGGNSSTYSSSSSSQKVQLQYENAIIGKVKQLLIGTSRYNDVIVAPKLDVDFSDVEIVETNYHAPEGSEEGLKSYTYEVNSSGAISDASGPAGTESNDQDTTYEIQNADGSTSEYSLKQYNWLQDQKITTTKQASGSIDYAKSSISIVAKNVERITEKEAKARGLLDDMTWDEFKTTVASVPTEIEITDDTLSMISTGTGIDTRNITLVSSHVYECYEEGSSSKSTDLSFIIQIVLAVLIAGLLIFIIIKSTRPVAVAETEPELSVEDMLATTKENRQGIEEIDLQDKSETRIAIEKFVDENPEAVAVLLRNWLNEGWN